MLGQNAEGEVQPIVGNQGETGMADQGAESGCGGERRDFFGKRAGVDDEMANAEGQKSVQLFAGGMALVERGIRQEHVFKIAGGHGGGVAIDQAHP